MALALTSAYLSYFVIEFHTLWKHDEKAQMQEGQEMSSSTTTEVVVDNKKTQDEALDFTASLRH
jgi:hypothetical protein